MKCKIRSKVNTFDTRMGEGGRKAPASDHPEGLKELPLSLAEKPGKNLFTAFKDDFESPL